MSTYPPPRPFVLRALHGLIVTLILLQLILPSAVLAAPPLSPPAIPITKPLPTPPTQENPVDATFEDVAVAPPLDDRPAPQAALPVALFVRLTSDRTLLHPGEKATLIVNAWRATEEKLDGALLTLELPPELKQAKGEVELQWRLPELEKTAIFSQTVAVQLVGGAFPFETAVVRAVLHTAATEQFSENRAEVVFGLDSRAPEPPASPVAKAVLREKGLVLQGRYGDVTVLVEEGSAAAETTFTYTDGYRLGEAQPAALTATKSVTAPQALTTTGLITTHPALTTTTPPTTPAVLTTTTIISAAAGLSSTTNLLYLPVVSGEDDVAQTAQQTTDASGAASAVPDTPAPSAAELPVDNGVSFVRRWQLDAALGDEQITKFATRIGLVIDASWLLAQKFDPERLTLYTREDPKQGWEEVPDVHYDAEQHAFIAHIGHFSEYSLGLIDTNVVGESLPDVRSFDTDLFTGAATINYPIELPGGPGGMAPQLSLNYSTATVDTERWSNYKNESGGYRVQAGLPGIGWNIGGLGYIAWASKGSDVNNGNDDHYSFVFNGTSDEFRYTDTQTESFAKITKNLTTQPDPTDGSVKVTGTGSWTVTTPDGTQHIFGGAPVHYSNSSTTSNQSILLDDIGALDTYRWVNKWYLSKSIDGNGNYIEYSYNSDKRETNCSTNNKYRGAGGWYYRAIRPASITWGGNQTTGVPHRMKVIFDYESRTDIDIWNRTDPCTQSIYSTDRLKRITVQVHSENLWKPFREYELSYEYTAPPAGPAHSWLNAIALYGFASNGTRTATHLQTYSFAYIVYAIHSEVYMMTAKNGRGGIVSYDYVAPQLQICSIDGTTTCELKPYRRQVNVKRVYDGIIGVGLNKGNWTQTSYGYGLGILRKNKNDPVDFLGYESAWTITYAVNGTTTEAAVTENWFYRNNGNTSPTTIANNPDPRLGRLDFKRVLQPISASCPVAQQVNYGSFQRCKMAETNPTYTALTGSGPTWTPISNYTTHPRWVRQDSIVNWTDGAALAKVFTYDPTKQGNNQFGNVTKVEESDVSSNGTLTLLRRTETEYFPNTSAYVVNLPARVQVYKPDGTCKAEQRYVYGAYWNGSTMVSNVGGTYKTSAINTRLVKTQVALKNCSATESIQDTDNDWAITRYAYDPYGNQVTENRLGNSDLVTNTDFDSTYHLFPTRRYRTVGATAYDETAFYYGINPASGDPALSDTRAHWGALAEWCGVNEVCSRYAYDDYGRVNRQWDGEITNESWNGVNDNLDATAAVMWTYNMSGTVDSVNNVTFKRNVIEEWHAPRCYGNFSRKVYDGLGQLIQVQGPQQDWTTNRNGCNLTNNGKEVDVSYTYDALGNQTRAGVPVATTANYVNRAENWGAGYTATTYDALGRPKTVTAPNGEVQQYDYVGRAWALIGLGRNGDSNKYLKWQENDALGNLKSVATWYWGLSGQTYTWLVEGQVTLAYDVIGNLTDVFHPTGQTTHMEYDLGGRKSNMNDPDLGYWVYVYDRQHKLTQQTDARGCTTTLLYDTLGRLTTKQLRKPEYTACQALAAADADVTYGYDSGHSSTNRSRGQLTSINNPSYAKGISYNATGLLVREEVWISGVSQNVVTLYDYDAYRRPTRITYPDNEYTTTTYNGMGLPNSLYTNALGTTNDGFLVDGITSGGDTTNGANYDEAGRLRNLRFPAPLGSNLWQSYYYFPWTLSPWNAADGNSNGRLWYIGLSTSVNGNERMLLDYRYDSFGNVRQYSANEGGWQTFGYDYQNRLIEANSAVNGPEYTYDAAGRLTGYETTTYTGYRGHGITTYGGTQRYYYDANGNVVNRRWGLGNQQALTWDLENRLSQVTGGNGYAETYLYDADGQRVKKSNGFGGVTYYVNPHYEMTNETVWVDDALPGGASVVGDSDGWTWESGNPASGTAYHRSATLAGTHQHYFYDAKETLKLSSGDVLYAYVYLDPASPPQEVMLQWYDTAGSWEHRAYWGQNQISFGTDGTNSRRYIGALPATGGWVRLEVPAAQVGLVGQTVTGMAYTLYGGRAWWDRAGARHAALRVTKNYHFNGQLIAQRKNGVLSYLHGDHLSSTMLTTNGSGTTTGDHRYYPYGRRRDGAELGTESRFTGQKLDGTGLQYFNSRYYDPELGTFISPDTLVPDPTNLFDYNRYMYVRGNPLKYNDPTGHDPCGPGANPHCAEYLQGLTTSGCQGNCGVSYDQFLTAKQQYADYKADPEQYAVDQQTLNGDVVGDVEAAKTRLSYGLLYASYFAHKNPDVDITMQASVDVLLASMSIISGNAKDAITSNYYRSGKPYSTKELNEAGATRLRRDPADVKSDGFADFIRSKTGSFRAREWEKVMETWEYLDGRTIENHYWRNKKTGDTYHHE